MSLLYEAQLALDKAYDCLDDAAFNLSNNRTIVAVNYDLEATISDSEATDLFNKVNEFYDFTESYFQGLIRKQSEI